MKNHLLWRAVVLAVVILAGCVDRGRDRPPDVMQDFSRRVRDYVALEHRAKDQAPPLRTAYEPDQFLKAQAQLANAIRAARPNARQGDIFTSEISAEFRRRIRHELTKPGGRNARALVGETGPAQSHPKVNDTYPDVPLSTVPPPILSVLPQLPKELEYRFVDNDLVIRDVGANLIVDLVPDAITRK